MGDLASKMVSPRCRSRPSWLTQADCSSPSSNPTVRSMPPSQRPSPKPATSSTSASKGKTGWTSPISPFWMAALSFRILGINSFAYKFPALLFWAAGAGYTLAVCLFTLWKGGRATIRADLSVGGAPGHFQQRRSRRTLSHRTDHRLGLSFLSRRPDAPRLAPRRRLTTGRLRVYDKRGPLY